MISQLRTITKQRETRTLMNSTLVLPHLEVSSTQRVQLQHQQAIANALAHPPPLQQAQAHSRRSWTRQSKRRWRVAKRMICSLDQALAQVN